ncbi:hypothetical protein [Pontibacter sp. HSC-14F20]|nr:hypothetical protein [Pontibacter sp. HSC-14F20]
MSRQKVSARRTGEAMKENSLLYLQQPPQQNKARLHNRKAKPNFH